MFSRLNFSTQPTHRGACTVATLIHFTTHDDAEQVNTFSPAQHSTAQHSRRLRFRWLCTHHKFVRVCVCVINAVQEGGADGDASGMRRALKHFRRRRWRSRRRWRTRAAGWRQLGRHASPLRRPRRARPGHRTSRAAPAVASRTNERRQIQLAGNCSHIPDPPSCGAAARQRTYHVLLGWPVSLCRVRNIVTRLNSSPEVPSGSCVHWDSAISNFKAPSRLDVQY